MNNKNLIFLCFNFALFLSFKLFAVKTTLDVYKDGSKLVTVDLPFPYYQRQNDDEFFFLHQSGYAIFDVVEDAHKVVVTGPLIPCVGIAVSNTKKLIMFHANPSNSMMHMKEIITQHFQESERNELLARVFSLNSEESWRRQDWHILSDLPTHLEFVKNIKASLQETGIKNTNIVADRWDEKSEHGQTIRVCEGYYYGAQREICVRINQMICSYKTSDNNVIQTINFNSIGAFAENTLDLNGYEIEGLFAQGVKMTYADLCEIGKAKIIDIKNLCNLHLVMFDSVKKEIWEQSLCRHFNVEEICSIEIRYNSEHFILNDGKDD